MLLPNMTEIKIIEAFHLHIFRKQAQKSANKVVPDLFLFYKGAVDTNPPVADLLDLRTDFYRFTLKKESTQ